MENDEHFKQSYVETVENKLRDYLGFHPANIFDTDDQSYIFGGCLRSIVAGDHINDVDVMTTDGHDCDRIVKRIKEEGYELTEKTHKNNMRLYFRAGILEPYTFEKIQQGSGYTFYSYIDVLRPVRANKIGPTPLQCIQEVDFICNGLAWNPNTQHRLVEVVNGAYEQSKKKIAVSRPRAKMYHETNVWAKTKEFKERGWTVIDAQSLEEM